MDIPYAKVIIKGSPITKSNFKLFNSQGRAILPDNSGKSHDRYAIYEQQIALEARRQNPKVVLQESLIAILKVYYKSEKRHPDTINITKSIFDGIEKSGLIINDVQIRKIITEEYYDKENPRFELELFGESYFNINYSIKKNENIIPAINFNPPSSKKKQTKPSSCQIEQDNIKHCSICNSPIESNDFISADSGKTLICRPCFIKSF